MHAPRLSPRILALALAASTTVRAAPVLAPVFGDHAVLQVEKPVPVWGQADPGEHLVIAFAGQSVAATAGPDGRWSAVLSALAAGGAGGDLSVTGKATVVSHDVVAGEVWLCAGGSGMSEPLGGGPARGDEASAARFPQVRAFVSAPAARSGGAPSGWILCSPQTVRGFPSVGYAFARSLHTRLGSAVGIVVAAVAASPIESWMAPAPGTPEGALFAERIDPLLPLAARGVVWYQGEGDLARTPGYGGRFTALIRGWRTRLGQGELPFLWVQLASFGRATGAGERGPALREGQAQALSLPAAGQAVAIDMGAVGDARPRDDQEIGRRLALIAKAQVYGLSVDYSGPVPKGFEPEGGSLKVEFAHAGDGLTAAGKPLQSFEVAGQDRVFHPATAAIRGSAVVVQSPAVRQPIAVRYAWHDGPEANLFNGAGLPAAPFRSDSW